MGLRYRDLDFSRPVLMLNAILSIAGSIFDNRLASVLVKIPGLSTELVEALKQSVIVISSLPEPLRGQVRESSIKSLTAVFLISLVSAVMATASSV